MFKFLGRFAAAHPWMICAAWVVAGLLVTLIAPKWDNRAQDDDIRFLPARCDSVRGYHLLQEAFPEDVFASRVIFAVERADAPLTDADLALVDDILADLNALRQAEPALQINKVYSLRDPFVGKRLLSEDGRCTLIQVALGTPYLALQTRTTVDRAEQCVHQRVGKAGPDAPHLYTTGPAGIGRDLISAGGDSLDKTTLATIILVVVILLLVYRAPLLALVPLVTIAGSVWVALKLLALCTLIPGFHLVNISQIFAIVMLYGAGTDYCLFLISRYREELTAGHDRSSALSRSVGHVGGALAASAGTVIVGLGMMGFAEFAKVRSGGPAIAISLAVALVASLTLAPALLQLLGKAVFWPTGMPVKQNVEPRPAVWTRLSQLVSRRPLLIWSVAVVVLLPLVFIGFQVKANYRATGELSVTSSSVTGLAAIQKHFTAGEVGPLTVLLESDTDWDSPAGQLLIAHLSQGFGRLENIAEVRSMTQPLGTPLPLAAPSAPSAPTPKRGFTLKNLNNTLSKGINDQVHRQAKEHYVAQLGKDGATRYVTRLDVVPHTDPFDPQSIQTLDLVQIWLREELPRVSSSMAAVHAECYGVTVNARDLAQVTESDRVRINVLVLAGVFVILLILVRKPWLAAYLLVTVLFSYYATLGATTLMATVWSGRAFGEVDWRVPFFLFTILVAVGEDYNILLITRALSERKRHGADMGMQRALAHTGGTITSCGLIMAGTFATLMLAGLNTLVQIGFALAFGVLLDTFIVRPFLVPALVLFVWRRQEKPVDEAVTLPLRPSEYKRAV